MTSKHIHSDGLTGRSWHLALLCAMALLIGCGKDSNENDDRRSSDEPVIDAPEDPKPDKPVKDPVQVKETQTSPVLIFLGGYSSCVADGGGRQGPIGMDLIDMFDVVKASVQTPDDQGELPYVLACYRLDPANITYLLSTDPQTTRTQTVAKFQDDVNELLGCLEEPLAFVVGHSYGAYTAVELMRSWQAGFEIGALVTLDAISKVGCTPAALASALLGQSQVPAACQQAPADVSKQEQQDIAALAGVWFNLYQTDSTILHSGPMESATNRRFEYSSAGFSPHMDIIADPVAIQLVTETVSVELSQRAK